MTADNRRLGSSHVSNVLRRVAFAVLLFGQSIGAHAGWLTFEVPLELPDPAALGAYQGDVRFVLGDVRDDVFAESPEFLGTFETSFKGLHVVVGEMSREEAVTTAVTHILGGVGLLASSPGNASHTLDIHIRRDRLWYLYSHPRRLRSEVFLEFVVTAENSGPHRVLACGNAEAMVNSPKDHAARVYQSAFRDAFEKFLDSEVFSLIVGTGWTPGSSGAAPSQIDRIDREVFYGPSDYVVDEVLPLATSALPRGPIPRLILQDFDLVSAKLSKKKAKVSPELTRRCIPELVREHLETFYPGAIPEIERRSSWEDREGLVMTGEIIRYDSRGEKHRLMVDIHFRDGSTGEELFSIRVHWVRTNMRAVGLLDVAVKAIKYSADEKKMMATRIEGPNTASWTGHFASGWLRDMVDYLAQNIAYLVAASLYPDYSYPDEIEVRFDAAPYPGVAALTAHNR